MKPLMTVTLAGGAQTEVLLAEDIKDLSAHLGDYGRSVLWVFDSNTNKLFRQLPPARIILDSGEQSKNLTSLERIISLALDEGLGRDGRIIGFGGGVVGDISSLAASLYMRGCRLTLVPTTLLAMVDASIGGKTAVDFQGMKNMIGTFYPANEVLISIDVLKSLSEREYKSGLAEVIKHALLSEDQELFKLLLSRRSEILDREEETLMKLVELSLLVKKSYIERDPTETKGIRKALNLGHTFGHALESSTRFAAFSHGAAVAWGTVRALEAGVALGITDKKYASSASKLFGSFGYDLDHRIGRGEWIEYKNHLSKDKKKLGGEVQFVLLGGNGKPELHPLPWNLIQALVMEKAIGRG
jgi:3-dehydroquinate synthase